MSFEDSFEVALASIRTAHLKALGAQDDELKSLRRQLDAKDQEAKDLSARLSQTEHLLRQAEKRVAEMTRSVTKLATFKQTVMASLQNEEEDEGLDNLMSGLGINGLQNTPSPQTHTQHSRTAPSLPYSRNSDPPPEE
ncbi:hypothetical protein HDU98_000916, partial [Podochytrium sp. JEL0797]